MPCTIPLFEFTLNRVQPHPLQFVGDASARKKIGIGIIGLMQKREIYSFIEWHVLNAIIIPIIIKIDWRIMGISFGGVCNEIIVMNVRINRLVPGFVYLRLAVVSSSSFVCSPLTIIYIIAIILSVPNVAK